LNRLTILTIACPTATGNTLPKPTTDFFSASSALSAVNETQNHNSRQNKKSVLPVLSKACTELACGELVEPVEVVEGISKISG